MTKKDKRTLIRSKIKKDLETAHKNEIAELMNSVEDLKQKQYAFGKGGRTANFSISLRGILPGN